MKRARNQAQWYPAERGARGRLATVAAGVDFVAQETRDGDWQLSFWNEHEGRMAPVRLFPAFGELRDHVDLSAPDYAKFNRQARVRHGRAVNQPDVGFRMRDELMAEAESCGEHGDVECVEQVLEKARRELSADPGLLADVENVVDAYFPELMGDDVGVLKRRLTA